MDLSIVIVNWNSGEDLARCLTSIASHASGLDCETIVVDGGSRDGSPLRVARRFGWVRLICARANRGFAAGCNTGLAVARGRLKLLLNPDCIVHPGALEALVAFADAHPESGLIGARLLNLDGSLQPSCRRFPSLGALLFRNTPLGALWPRNPFAASYLMHDDAHAEPREVDWLSGACLLIGEAAWRRLGPLDDGFFMYCEDMDYCRRAHQLGLPVVYFPGATVTHKIGGSSDRVPLKMVRAHHRSMWRFVRKHHGLLAAALAAPLLAARAVLVVCCRWRRAGTA